MIIAMSAEFAAEMRRCCMSPNCVPGFSITRQTPLRWHKANDESNDKATIQKSVFSIAVFEGRSNEQRYAVPGGRGSGVRGYGRSVFAVVAGGEAECEQPQRGEVLSEQCTGGD